MSDSIINLLTQHIDLSEQEIEIIKQLDIIREYKKGTILLKEGEISKYCYFIIKGCLRSYIIKDGEEISTDFFTEGQPVTPVSYITKQPSAYYLSLVEDGILSVGSEATTDTIRQKVPKMELLISHFNEKLFAESQIKFENYLTLSPTERYERLIKTRPELLQRVPQYMIASYLGLKPESLSRIRKKLGTK